MTSAVSAGEVEDEFTVVKLELELVFCYVSGRAGQREEGTRGKRKNR